MKAARALLDDMTQQELADLVGVSVGTIRSIEASLYQRHRQAETLSKIHVALGISGIEFLNDEDVEGVQLRSRTKSKRAT